MFLQNFDYGFIIALSTYILIVYICLLPLFLDPFKDRD